MDTLRFIGHLSPRAVLINARLPDLDWKWEEKRLLLKFKTEINNSIINVECQLDKYHPEYFSELHRRSFDLARTAANLACFAIGDGVSSAFEFVILPDGTSSIIRYHDSSLANLCRSYSLNSSDFGDVAKIVVMEPATFAALNDLIESVTVPHVAAVNCGRVVEGIRRIVAPNLEDSSAWTVMRKALNISRPYLELITRTSAAPRHGDRKYIPGTTTTELTRRTWVIMDRYLEYRKRGNVELTAPQFPELV